MTNPCLPVRAGEFAATGLTDTLNQLGLETGRLKTGTPARVDRRSINFDVLEPQPGDEDVRWFSFDPELWVERKQMPCHLTRTTAATHTADSRQPAPLPHLRRLGRVKRSPLLPQH